MHRSKLEIAVDIVKALASIGPLNPSEMALSAKIDQSLIDDYLKLLVDAVLVKQTAGVGKHAVARYAITPRGFKILHFFNVKTTIPQKPFK